MFPNFSYTKGANLSITVLSSASAYNPGSDIWFIPPLASSSWSQKMNWYLNFQLSRTKNWKQWSLPEYLANTVEDIKWAELKPHKWSTNEDLLIASSNYLPNKWTLMSIILDDLTIWQKTHYLTMQKLNLKSARFFLPKGISPSQFSESWKRVFPGNDDDLTLVAELI